MGPPQNTGLTTEMFLSVDFVSGTCCFHCRNSHRCKTTGRHSLLSSQCRRSSGARTLLLARCNGASGVRHAKSTAGRSLAAPSPLLLLVSSTRAGKKVAPFWEPYSSRGGNSLLKSCSLKQLGPFAKYLAQPFVVPLYLAKEKGRCLLSEIIPFPFVSSSSSSLSKCHSPTAAAAAARSPPPPSLIRRPVRWSSRRSRRPST